MKITLDINEAKILELAKESSMDDLPRNIYYEARRQAIEIATKELKDKIVFKSYFDKPEELYREVKQYLLSELKESMESLLENEFKKENVEKMFKQMFERVFTEWMSKRVYERLDEIKNDIYIGSNAELEYERKAEIESLQEQQ